MKRKTRSPSLDGSLSDFIIMIHKAEAPQLHKSPGTAGLLASINARFPLPTLQRSDKWDGLPDTVTASRRILTGFPFHPPTQSFALRSGHQNPLILFFTEKNYHRHFPMSRAEPRDDGSSFVLIRDQFLPTLVFQKHYHINWKIGDLSSLLQVAIRKNKPLRLLSKTQGEIYNEPWERSQGSIPFVSSAFIFHLQILF